MIAAVRDITSSLHSEDCRFADCVREAEFSEGPSKGLCREHAERVLKQQLGNVTADLAARRKAHVPRSSWSEETIIAALQSWAAEHGAAPYASQWRSAEDGRPTEQTVRDRFGGWDVALEAAGLTPNYPRAVLTVTPDAALSGDDVRELGRELAAELSGREQIDEVRVQTRGTVGKEAEVVVRKDDSPSPPHPPKPERDEPFDSGTAEGMRATYVELLLARLEKLEVYNDKEAQALRLMDRIERLLWSAWPTSAVRKTDDPFHSATDDLGRLGKRVEHLLAQRERASDRLASTENEVESLLVRIRKIADEWVINELGGPSLEENS